MRQHKYSPLNTIIEASKSDTAESNKTNSTDIINYIFDILTAIISLLDLITDIIVTIQYYYEEKYSFFITSLLILLAAQISYITIFKYRYRYLEEDEKALTTFQKIKYSLCLVLLSPILSFIFYFAADENDRLTKFLDDRFKLKLHVFIESDKDEKNEPKMIKWMKKKLGSHVGFIAESIMESFPQSIIQMTAMVLYKKVNIFSVVSILLSLLSISTKSFVICVASAIDILTQLFSWLCIVTDFIAIYTVISFVFYFDINNNLLFKIWFYKLLIFILPGAIFMSVSYAVLTILDCRRRPYKYKTNVYSLSIGLCVQVIFFIMLLTILAETVCLSVIAGFIFINGQLRFGSWNSSLDSDFWRVIFRFIRHKNYGNINNTCNNWRIQKICCINYIASKPWSNKDGDYPQWFKKHFKIYDETMNTYLEQKSVTYFQDITYRDIRENTSKADECHYLQVFKDCYTDIHRYFKDKKEDMPSLNAKERKYETQHQTFHYVRWLCGFIGTFVVIPWAVLSKIISLIFPFIMIYYVNDTTMLQQCMFYIFITLQLIICGMFIFVIQTHYWIWHIFPSQRLQPIRLKRIKSESFYENIMKYYKHICDSYSIDQIVLEKFGPNIGEIILSYRDNIIM